MRLSQYESASKTRNRHPQTTRKPPANPLQTTPKPPEGGLKPGGHGKQLGTSEKRDHRERWVPEPAEGIGSSEVKMIAFDRLRHLSASLSL